MRTFLRYGAGLIGLYLLVAYASGSGQVIKDSAAGSALLVQKFQGR